MKRTFVFLGLVDDHDGNLNKTAVLLYVVSAIYIYKMVTAQPSPIEMGGLLTVILNSLGKKAINAKTDSE